MKICEKCGLLVPKKLGLSKLLYNNTLNPQTTTWGLNEPYTNCILSHFSQSSGEVRPLLDIHCRRLM